MHAYASSSHHLFFVVAGVVAFHFKTSMELSPGIFYALIHYTLTPFLKALHNGQFFRVVVFKEFGCVDV